MRHTNDAFRWSIDVFEGWTVETRFDTSLGERTPFLAICPATNDALLRLTPDERGIMAATKWVEDVRQINRARGLPVWLTQCGDFVGNTVEYATPYEWIRGWALCADSVPLDATYRCKLCNAGRDDRVVDRFLNSLRLDRSATRKRQTN